MNRPVDNQRYHAMDALRGSMMLLGVLFHAALPYMMTNSVQGFNDPDRHTAFDALVLFIYSFRTPAFFVTAGFFAALLYHRRGVRLTTINRFQRIFLPLVIGWLVLAPLTRGAYNFALAVTRNGTLASGIDAIDRFDWLRWDNPFHLWFLIALLILYPMGLGTQWLLARLPSRWFETLADSVRSALSSPMRPVFLAVPLAVGLIPASFYPFGRANVFLGLVIWIYFSLGWLLYAHRDLLAGLAKHAWTYVILGTAVLPAVAYAWRGAVTAAAGDAFAITLAAGTLYTAMSALLVFGVIGVFIELFDKPGSLARYLSDASYWIYLVHLPLVVLIGGILSSVAWPPMVKLGLNVAVTTAILLIGYHFLVRYTVIGALLNGRRQSRPREALVAAE